MLKQGKITSGLGLSILVSQRTVCKEKKKAVIVTKGMMTTELKMSNV